ncbi:MAG TPA: molybdopterin-dependent oxidoreductase [Candidatus Saccharimonadales bacterium]|nr:molybdopterin-dependent oxidoreductase [Candidatus Saccharimonadales bacterium]
MSPTGGSDRPRPARERRLSRRGFLYAAAAGAAAFALPGCSTGEKPRLTAFTGEFDPLRTYPYRGWEEFYRKMWTWDKVVRSTHSANCTGSCSWNVYVRDGVMVREEQAADYPRISEDLPDYNPRGCQKGGCFVEYVYSPQRLRFPLIRTGERGEGKWRRATWDEALTQVAEKLLDNIYHHGPDTNTFFSVIPAMSPVSFSAGARLAHYLGGVVLSFYDWYCDLPPGEPLTWGVQTEACECADWFNAKYIVLWGSNISQTRIPDAHFAYEARYNGAKIVAISPDFNSSAMHADLYWRINPGTDAALAMGVARILVDENLVDLPYVKEQTDLPLLLITETGRFLRESDLRAGGSEEIFNVWDERSGRVVQAPGSMGSPDRTIRWNGVEPALTGTYEATLADGRAVEVRPVFERLRETLAGYPLDTVAARTGLPAHEIQTFARELGTRKPAMIIHGAGTNHWFHNDLANRAMILLVALTGNVGRNGGGFNHYVGQERVWPEKGFLELAFPEGRTKQRFQNTTLWSYVHSANRDPHLYNGKPIDWYIDESVKNGWMPLWPAARPGGDDGGKARPKPRAMVIWRANYLNQAKGNEILESSLWRDLDLIVDINYRMDTTALYSDVVLPAGTYYEKVDLSSTDCHSYMHTFGKALDPLFESRTDWDIFRALAEKVAELARKKGLAPFDDPRFEWKRDLTRLVEDWTGGGKVRTDEDAANFILSNSVETAGMTYANLQAHPRRFVATDAESWNSDIEPGVAYTPFKHQLERKRPWRTLTGRQQFYIDHPWFIELGEELPVFKEPVPEKYPLFWNTPHGRWSIHSTWRDHRALLRLQRGLPIVYMHHDDARARGLRDNDWVRIFNDIGQCVCRLKILPGEKPGRVTMYHGWEKFLGFQQGGWQSLTYIKIKPTQLIGGYGHVKFRLNYWGPTGNNRDIKVEVEKANVAPAPPASGAGKKA